MTDGSRRRRSRLRATHPLLNPFPVIVASLAAFLVAFTLLSARVTSGVVPQLGTPAAGSDARAAGGAPLRTRASGSSATRAVSSQSGPTAPIVTRTSVRTGGDDA